MHARSTNIHGDPARIDDAVAYLRGEVLPDLAEAEGWIGLSTLTDSETGRCIVATAWADKEAMRATAEEVRPTRHRVEHLLGSQHSDVQEWEIAVLHRDRAAGDGAAAQVTWARITPDHVDGLLDAYRMNLLPRLGGLPGFCSVSLLVDRRAGRTVSVTSFENRDALALARRHARSLREQFAQAMGAKIVDVHEMDLAVAHLRVPETV
jgi:heme-degrading monooxygenase HmoA